MKMVIYKIINRLNGKPYVGQTKQPIEKRFLQHFYAQTPLGQAMRQCGIKNFTIEVIERCKTQKQLNEREIFWIRVLNSKQPYGYNVREGGGGYQKKFICNSRVNNFDKEKLIRIARMAIQDRLLSGKFSIEKVFNGYMAEDCFRRKILFEILIASNALESYGFKWAIKVMSNSDDYNVVEHFLEKLLAKICAQKNDAEKIKFSVVIFNEKIFNYVKKECQNIYLPSYVSLILIDENSQTIKDEYILNFKNSDEHVNSVLTQEAYSQLDFEIKEGDDIS